MLNLFFPSISVLHNRPLEISVSCLVDGEALCKEALFLPSKTRKIDQRRLEDVLDIEKMKNVYCPINQTSIPIKKKKKKTKQV